MIQPALITVMLTAPLSARAADDRLTPVKAIRAIKAARNPDEIRMDDIVSAVERPHTRDYPRARSGSRLGRTLFLGALVFFVAVGGFMSTLASKGA